MSEYLKTFAINGEPTSLDDLINFKFYSRNCFLWDIQLCPDQTENVRDCHECPAAIDDHDIFIKTSEKVNDNKKPCPVWGRIKSSSDLGNMAHTGTQPRAFFSIPR